MAIRAPEGNPKGQSGQEGKYEDQGIKSKPGVNGIENCARQPSVSNPWLTIVSKGKGIRSGNHASFENVLACFEVKPEVGIVDW